MSEKKIPIAKPDLDDAEIAAITEVIRSGWIIQGDRVAKFEKAFADFVGAPEAIAVSSGTAALHLALLASNCKPGKSVICPSYSFISTANVIRHCGAEPIFVDIEADTYNIDPKLIEAAIREDTCAILTVHQVGLPCDLDAIREIATRNNLCLIEDAACATGSEYRDERIGKPHSLAACFSFHPRKIITTGDGGMITTADREFAARVRRLRQHGLGTQGEGFVEVGYNYRLTDMQAALGVEQVKKLPHMLETRRRQAERYTLAFLQSQWLTPPAEPPGMESNYQSYQLRIKEGAPKSRDEMLKELIARGISAQPGIAPIHVEKIYQYTDTGTLPETERAAREVIMLPIYHTLSEADQQYIIDAVLDLAGR